MIIKANEISGKDSGWLKKITPEKVNLKKNNGYSLTGAFYKYNESVVIKKGEFFVIDTGHRGTRTLYNSNGKIVKKGNKTENSEKSRFF